MNPDETVLMDAERLPCPGPWLLLEKTESMEGKAYAGQGERRRNCSSPRGIGTVTQRKGAKLSFEGLAGGEGSWASSQHSQVVLTSQEGNIRLAPV